MIQGMLDTYQRNNKLPAVFVFVWRGFRSVPEAEQNANIYRAVDAGVITRRVRSYVAADVLWHHI